MSEITKEKMLEWLEMECVNCNCAPRESEVCREQEDIDQCLSTVAALEALIESGIKVTTVGERIFSHYPQDRAKQTEGSESSGDKASGPAEKVVEMRRVATHFNLPATPSETMRVSPSKEWGKSEVFEEAAIVKAIPVYGPAPSPAPLPKEVEEAMETIRLRLNDLHIMEGDDRAYIPGDDAAFSVLKAALRPKVVSREWLVETAREITHLGGRLLDEEIPYFLKRLRELGIEVEEAMEKIITRLEGRGCSEEIDVIKASLRPMVVTRKWIRKRADWAGCLGVTDVAGILRELGIEVSEGEMR